MITENVSTLKIHKLSKEQYDREVANGRLENNAIYITPDDGAELTVADISDLTATATELNYVDGVTSNIQTQLNNKQAKITGGATTIASSNLTANRALVSNGSGKVAVSAVTSTELGYLDGVTSNVQTQLNNKVPSASPVFTGSISLGRASGTTVGANSVAMGDYIEASGQASSAIGSSTKAIGDYSHAEGVVTTTKGTASHAEGSYTTALASGAHAEGTSSSRASNTYEEYTSSGTIISDWDTNKFSLAQGQGSHVEGENCLALSAYAHAEGNKTKALGNSSHSEGCWSEAEGTASHSEGWNTFALGDYSHSEGDNAIASGTASHAEGYNTTALSYQHVQGHYNNYNTAGHGYSSGTSGTAFVIGNGSSSASTSNAFRVGYDGRVYATSSSISTGADYAEYFEWQDLNSDNEDRRGYFVTLDGDKIKIAEANDYVLGIVSGQPAIIGNGDEDWRGRYILDEFGAFITEEFEYEEEIPEIVTDEETGKTTVEIKTVTKTGIKYKENPDYDSSLPYVQRADRPEWAVIGMMGVLSVRDDGTCQVNGYCKVAEGGIATASENGYRVIKRINDHIVQVVFK